MKRIILGIVVIAVAAIAIFFFLKKDDMGVKEAASGGPALVYDLGGKFDKSFNEAAYNGAEKFKADTGMSYKDFEVQNDAQREQALRKFATDGNSPIVVAGFTFGQAVETVAKEFPDTKFAIIDMVVELPNVRSVVFKEQEGSYLAGVIAAKASETGTVGFVGGMGIPLISRFACGYKGGVKSVDANYTVIENMTGDTPAAWNDPVKGGEITKAQIAQGADVIYHAAGGTGVGVMQAAADAGKLAIGVDSNQNGMQPGKVLTSMLKRVDVAVYNAFKDGSEGGTWTSGFSVLGLNEGGVDLAMDENNKPLVTEDMLAAVDAARAAIVSGDVVVHDFMSDNSCPY